MKEEACQGGIVKRVDGKNRTGTTDRKDRQPEGMIQGNEAERERHREMNGNMKSRSN